jgi:predicted enzyme related to lactoylglutathione lyase
MLRDPANSGDRSHHAVSGSEENRTMKIQYLEIVTKEVDAVCASYAAANNVQFGEPDAGLGNARTAALADGGLVGVRAPLRETEQPVVRPYWLVEDIDAAVAATVQAGGQVAHPPMEIPGHGKFAIYLQGGNDHGLWQL